MRIFAVEKLEEFRTQLRKHHLDVEVLHIIEVLRPLLRKNHGSGVRLRQTPVVRDDDRRRLQRHLPVPRLQSGMLRLHVNAHVPGHAVFLHDGVANPAVARAVTIPAMLPHSKDLKETGAFPAERAAELVELLALKAAERLNIDKTNDGAHGVFTVVDLKRFNAVAVDDVRIGLGWTEWIEVHGETCMLFKKGFRIMKTAYVRRCRKQTHNPQIYRNLLIYREINF